MTSFCWSLLFAGSSVFVACSVLARGSMAARCGFDHAVAAGSVLDVLIVVCLPVGAWWRALVVNLFLRCVTARAVLDCCSFVRSFVRSSFGRLSLVGVELAGLALCKTLLVAWG